jgi:predicted transcriptional regulator
MAKKQSDLTEAEWAIIQAVWAQEPVPAPTIQELLADNRGWSYSTVKTIMDRMVTKGLLKAKRLRNLILYSSAISRRVAQRQEVLRTVKRAFDGAMTPMMQFLVDDGGLTHAQLDAVEQMIRAKKRAAQEKS